MKILETVIHGFFLKSDFNPKHMFGFEPQFFKLINYFIMMLRRPGNQPKRITDTVYTICGMGS